MSLTDVYGNDTGAYPEDVGKCPDCMDPVEAPATYHPGCCTHEDVDAALGFGGDPAREYRDRGTCTDCGAAVHLEHDEDRVVWEVD